MKRSLIILFALGIVFSGFACDETDDPTNDDIEDMTDNGAQGEIRFEVENCEAPNTVFDGKCCSIQGTWGGACKLDRDWVATGGCEEEFVNGGFQYCCGGQYLWDMGARGFQCIVE